MTSSRMEEDSDDDDDEDDDEPVVVRGGGKTLISSPTGGKQLRRPELPGKQMVGGKQLREAPPAGGKQLREAPGGKQLRVPSPGKQIRSAPAGGKQLRRRNDDDDDSSDDFSEEEEQVVKPRGRPARSTRTNRAIVDQESEDDDEMEMDQVDVNNPETLIKDEEDRKYLDSLPELEREAILAERFDKLKQEQDMKRDLLAAKQGNKTATKPQKKKPTAAAAAKPETVTGRRNKDASGAKSKKAAALAALKKEKKAQKQIHEMSDESDDLDDFGDDSDDSDDDYEEAGFKPWQSKAKGKSTVSRLDKGNDDDMDVDDEDDDEEDISRRKPKSEATPEKEAELADFLKVVIPRRRLKRWCNQPYFEEAVLGSFVRVFIGENPETGEKTYRLCEVMEVTEGNTMYKFPVANKNEVPVTTKYKLVLRFAENKKEFPMYLISDADPDESDVQKYISAQKSIRGEVISKRRCNKLKRLRDELVNNYRYTTKDIEQQLRQRKEEGKSTGTLGMEQTKAMIALQAAEDGLAEAQEKLRDTKKAIIENSDPSLATDLETAKNEAEELVSKCRKTLEEKKGAVEHLEQILEDRKQRLKKRGRDQDWAKVNQRALQQNQKADFNASKIQESANTKKKGDFDPYARRKVKPKILWEVGQDEKEESKGESEDKQAADSIENSSTPHLVPESTKDSLLSVDSHQFAIDEEDLAQSSSALILGKKSTKTRVRKGISLMEYMERKANGTL